MVTVLTTVFNMIALKIGFQSVLYCIDRIRKPIFFSVFPDHPVLCPIFTNVCHITKTAQTSLFPLTLKDLFAICKDINSVRIRAREFPLFF